MNVKFKRHNAILKIIAETPVENQRVLSDELRKAGFFVTQATVSRDIKELRLTKVLNGSNVYRYAAAPAEQTSDLHVRFRNIFRESVVHIDYAGNIIVIKTLSGVAGAATAAIDTMDLPHIVGSLAGDDTIFLIMRTAENAAALCVEIQSMIQ